MDLSVVVSLVLNGLLGIAVYLFKNSHSDIKEQLKESKIEIAHLKETKMDKMDFREFKEELWKRLDRFEDKLNKEN
jgi:hypothetical protein